MKHHILGNPINEPLADNQGEVLFGCGCFWGAEKAFWRLPGVHTTATGYAGGDTENPTYSEVCSGLTGHAEVVKVVWQKNLIDFSDLLKLFWECHDPTQGNRQGNDTGSQYRSTIYVSQTEDETKARSSMNSYQKLLTQNGYGKITTEIEMNIKFNYAEGYHQQYLAKPGARPYCSAMPTTIPLKDFKGSNFKLSSKIWNQYNWNIKHCILRSDNNQIAMDENL